MAQIKEDVKKKEEILNEINEINESFEISKKNELERSFVKIKENHSIKISTEKTKISSTNSNFKKEHFLEEQERVNMEKEDLLSKIYEEETYYAKFEAKDIKLQKFNKKSEQIPNVHKAQLKTFKILQPQENVSENLAPKNTRSVCFMNLKQIKNRRLIYLEQNEKLMFFCYS